MTCRQKARKTIARVICLHFTYECTSQGMKHWLFFGKYHLKVVKLKYCKIK